MLPLRDPIVADAEFLNHQRALFLVGRSLTEYVKSVEKLPLVPSEELTTGLTSLAEWFAKAAITLLSRHAAPDGKPGNFDDVEPHDSELVVGGQAPLSSYFQYMTASVQTVGYTEPIDIALLLGVRNKIIDMARTYAPPLSENASSAPRL